MHETDYFIIAAERGPSSCVLSTDVGDPPLSPPAEGDPIAKKWPKTVGFRMSNATPGKVVPDFVKNSFRYLMVSPRVKELFESTLTENIEYLPFTVIDHKGDDLDEPHFIVNVLDRLDCVDAKASKGDPDALNPGWFDYFEELHLDVKTIPADRRIFRLGSRPCLIVVHRALKEDIESRKFTGVGFMPMGGPEK